MERTIVDTLTTRLTESIEFNRRFGVVDPDVYLKIVNDAVGEILKCKDLQPSVDRDFLSAFDEVISEFCQSKLRLHPSLFSRHLANVRTVSERNKAKRAYEFESVEWYLAILGLTIESDPRSILSAFRATMDSNSSSRRLFDQVHGGKPRDDSEILEIRNLVIRSLDSVRAYRKSLKALAKPAEQKRKATAFEYCFSSYLKVVIAQLQLPAGHPVLKDELKSSVCKIATRSDSRTSVLRVGDAARISACFTALAFVHNEGLDIPLTAVSRCVSAYFLRPELNINERLLCDLRDFVATKDSKFHTLVSKTVRAAICDETKGSNAAFPDPKEVSMGYSYLNLPVNDRQMYTDDEIDTAAELIRSGLSKPHMGQYRSPYILDTLYTQWVGNPVAALKRATRALKNAMTRVKSF